MSLKTKEKTMDVQKKSKRRKKILLILIVVLLVLACLVSLKILKAQGFLSAGNNEKYSVANAEALENSPLKGKHIIFLGSSVTAGMAARGESFVDFMVKRDGIIAVKEAVSGTTLVDENDNSYITRIREIDPNISADIFVCQLSTNDASKDKPLGSISNSFELDDFDVNTVAGAIEYIIGYANQTWHCSVMFFTNPQYGYNDQSYKAMVNLLLDIQAKWNIAVLDLWNDTNMNNIEEATYKLYMVDKIHPTRAGYRDWWTPKFEDALTHIVENVTT
jgi:hypothetical protein